MKTVGVVGASGFVGSRVRALAAEAGWAVVPFSRTPREGWRVFPSDGEPDFRGLDAVINLAGESILGLWTPAKKRRIRSSRVESTSRVARAVAACSVPVLVNASAIGFYGETGEESADESRPVGKGFLAEVCREWERAADPAVAAGARVVFARIGFVLGRGGAMPLIAPLFRMGVGGNLGNGRQWMSCVHVDDVAGLMLWALDQALSGPLNAVQPAPVRNADFTRAVARAVHRPAILPAPAFGLKLALGELSTIMLDSLRVVPQVAIKNGYPFRFPGLPEALRDVLR